MDTLTPFGVADYNQGKKKSSKKSVAQRKKFYKSGVWVRKRQEILARDNFECQRCKMMGKVGIGNVVHHIKHLEFYPALALSDDNLVTLCERCHYEVHPEKNVDRGTQNTHGERWE